VELPVGDVNSLAHLDADGTNADDLRFLGLYHIIHAQLTNTKFPSGDMVGSERLAISRLDQRLLPKLVFDGIENL
jgi:hypothetical protein